MILLLCVLIFTHAMSSLAIVVVLIAASCTEIASGRASLSCLESLHGTKRGAVSHGYF